jgi:multidrug resistance efflux pump
MAEESDRLDDSRTVRRAYRRATALAVVGLALLGGMWTLKPASKGRAGTDSPSAPVSDSAKAAVFCFGLVDFERGTVALNPAQPGRIAEVLVHENQRVTAGSTLLRLDDRHARSRMLAAAAAVEGAEAALNKAKQSASRFPFQIAQQQALIDAAEHRIAAAKKSLANKRRLFNDKLIPQEEVGMIEEEIKTLEALQRAEQARLSELRLMDPATDVRRVEAELQTARANLDLARHVLDDCTLKAPSDGIVMRVLANRGEIFGERSGKSMLVFGPDGPWIIRAEVDQEFARGLEVGQRADAEDDVRPDHVWRGQVQSVSNWYLPRREIMDQMLEARDSRTLECLIALDPGQPPLRIGQRMRITVKR